MSSISDVSVGGVRKAMKSFEFSDGTIIPKGAMVVAPVAPIHMDETIYDNASQFNGFRFSELRERDGGSARHHSSNTNSEFLHFGHGPHGWQHTSKRTESNDSPGRFFAVIMLKLLLGFILLRYDIRTKDGRRPQETKFMAFIIPDMKAKLLIRKRC